MCAGGKAVQNNRPRERRGRSDLHELALVRGVFCNHDRADPGSGADRDPDCFHGRDQRGASGLVTVAGTSLGNAALLAAIALGLNWVLLHATYLFELLRWFGAAYLIWLGVRAWRSPASSVAIAAGNRVHFWRGVLVALSNPKTLAFFTAFLPTVRRSHATGSAPARRDVRGLGPACRPERLGLGRRLRPGSQLVPEAGTR